MKFASLLSGFVAAIALIAGSASAAGPIVTVNIQEIMQKSTAAQSIKEQMETKQKAFQSEMTKKEEQLNNEEQEIRKQRGVLAADAVEKKVKAFKAKAAAAQKDVQAKRAELDSAFSSSLAQIQKSVFDIIAGMARKGFSVALPTAQMLWADPSLDITNDVLAKLNSTLPNVKVTFKESSGDSKE